MKYTRIILKIFKLKFARFRKKAAIKPFALTISITDKCNSKCKTCNIWKNSTSKDINETEWAKVFENIDGDIEWITITGGEPFMRNDLTEIVNLLNVLLNPLIINIATNGILTDKIVETIKSIKSNFKGILNVNVSLDGTNESYKQVRGVNKYKQAINTIKILNKMKGVNVNVNTVISEFNKEDIDNIIAEVKKLNINDHTFEIIQIRKELNNLELEKYFEIDTGTMRLVKKTAKLRISNFMRYLLRRLYYKKIEDGQKQKCYSLNGFVHISNDGKVWNCGIKCDDFGDLKHEQLDLILNSKKANYERKSIRENECSCMMANADMVNNICNFKIL